MGVIDENKNKIEKVVNLLADCRSILFITGAGVSADSGLPTYRGIGGLYEDKVTEEGISVEMALSGEMLKARPSVTWKYISQIEGNCRRATFNRAHEVIAEMEKHFERVWVITQNIDSFHLKAGSRNVIEIHGNMYRLFCTKCGWQTTVKDYNEITIPPLCCKCENTVRPDVVFFGEELSQDKVKALQEEEIYRGFDIYFSVGTTSIFPYIKGPIVHARSLGKPTVEINPDQTGVSDIVDIKIPLGAVEALDNIWNRYKKLVFQGNYELQ